MVQECEKIQNNVRRFKTRNTDLNEGFLGLYKYIITIAITEPIMSSTVLNIFYVLSYLILVEIL